MSDMLGKLISTARGNLVCNSVVAATGIILVITIDDTRMGIMVFLATTTVESGLFSAIYGLRADWRAEPAARAVFWTVFAYFGVAFQALTMYIWAKRWWWTDDLRELLYLGLSVAGLNLVLTLTRLLGKRVYQPLRSKR